MGRYYYGNHFEGKFGFGVQPSDDPLIFGMIDEGECVDDEGDPCGSNDYWLADTGESRRFIKNVLDELYTKLGVPQELRKYSLNSQEEISDYSFTLTPYVFEPHYRKDDSQEDRARLDYYSLDEETAKEIFHLGDEYNNLDWCMIPKGNDRELVLCENRIYLGLCIMLDLTLDGECSINAEM